jgi:transcriptional regulator with XRE-family HTH domain
VNPALHRNTEDAGQKLKRRREELNLRYRDVEDASQKIAERRRNDEYAIALSRLADIENKGTVPSIYRIYSLAAIYRLDFLEILDWYGIDLSMLPADGNTADVTRTHLVGFSSDVTGSVSMPLSLDPGIDLRRTTYLSRMIQRWGRLPLLLLNGVDPRAYRYAYIGSDDWSMYPVLQPGSLVLIDETKRRIQNAGWTSDYDRPVYLLEHRGGFVVGWCSLIDGQVVVQPHPSSECGPQVFSWPAEIDVVGQVVGVAMRFEGRRRRPKP